MANFVKFLNSSHSGIDRLHHDYSYATTQREHNSVKKEVCSIIYTLKFILRNPFMALLYPILMTDEGIKLMC